MRIQSLIATLNRIIREGSRPHRARGGNFESSQFKHRRISNTVQTPGQSPRRYLRPLRHVYQSIRDSTRPFPIVFPQHSAPFTMFSEQLKQLKVMGPRQVALQILNLATVLCTGLMIWKGLGLVLNNESPIVVVLSGSMEPAFYRGDLLFLANPPNTPFQIGDITVYKIPGEPVPIVHRILETHTSPKNPLKQKILTKGDNNPTDDIGLYNGREWLERQHFVGKVKGFMPFVGYVTIAMNDFPQLKYALIGFMGLLALFQREN